MEAFSVPLQPCSGERTVEGDPLECPEDCVTHWEACADSRRHYNLTASPLEHDPQSGLAWVHLHPPPRRS